MNLKKDLPLRVEYDGSYIRVVTKRGERIMVTTGKPRCPGDTEPSLVGTAPSGRSE